MEAATTLLRPHVRVHGTRLLIDGLVVDDACAIALVQAREDAGEDPARVVGDALVIGARVLDREQAGAHADFVRAEFERQARELEASFGDSARAVAEQMARKVDEAFAPESGHLTRALTRHFDDSSAAAVQHRVRALVDDVMRRAREDLLRQFSAADGSNPLADFKQSAVTTLRDAGATQERNLRALHAELAALKQELQGLRDERRAAAEVEAERARGTAKGRTFEEGVAEALDAIARARGDDCDAVGDVRGATGKTGDVVVSIDAAAGPARGRIVFEAKSSRLSKQRSLAELDGALAERDADFAVLVVPGEDQVPARMFPLREYQGDKLIVTFDPAEGGTLGLEVAYALARARVLMAREGRGGIDAAALGDRIERALAALEDVRKVKSQLTGANTAIESARSVLDDLARRVRAQLEEIASVLAGGRDGAA